MSAPKDTEVELWNDLTVTKKLARRFDLYIPFKIKVGHDVSQLTEAKFGAGITFKPVERFSITPVYYLIRYPDSSSHYHTEHRLSLKATYQFPTRYIEVSHTSQFEFRIRQTGNSWRYRPSVTIDRKLPRQFGEGTKVFLTEEPFYDSATGRFSRNRISGGIAKPLSKKVTLKVYYLYQGDDHGHPASAHVIGTAWQIKL